MATLRRLLVAIDFTETSDRALTWAIDLASQVSASVTVLHAYELPVIPFPDGGIIATAEVAVRIGDAARAALDKAVAQHAGRGVSLVGLLRQGVAWEEINAVADEIDADLVVIGTHGRRGFARALLGSVAEKVVRSSPRPVATIRAPGG
jgi:nucleotide-binding universal stress UspA family protein